MFDLDPRSREIVYVGQGLDMRAGYAPGGRVPTSIPCRIDQIGEALGAMRSLLAGLRPQAEIVAGVPLSQWAELLEKLRKSSYGVIVWAAPDFYFPHAELTVQTLSALIKDLNRTTRVCGVPLGGSDGDFTANGVLMWQTGLPFRSSFDSGIPVYEPHLNSTQRLLDSGEADAESCSGSALIALIVTCLTLTFILSKIWILRSAGSYHSIAMSSGSVRPSRNSPSKLLLCSTPLRATAHVR